MLSILLNKVKTVQRVEKSFGSKFDSVRLENSLKRTIYYTHTNRIFSELQTCSISQTFLF